MLVAVISHEPGPLRRDSLTSTGASGLVLKLPDRARPSAHLAVAVPVSPPSSDTCALFEVTCEGLEFEQ